MNEENPELYTKAKKTIAATAITKYGIVLQKKLETDKLPSDYILYTKFGQLFIFLDDNGAKMITYDEYKKAKKALAPPEKYRSIKMFFSWIILYISCFISATICHYPIKLCFKLIEYFIKGAPLLNGFWDILVVFFTLCFTWIFIILLATISIKISDRICKSGTATRFKVFGIYFIASRALSILCEAIDGTFKSLPMCIVTIVLGIYILLGAKGYWRT